jgi:hypothetical protein
MMDRTLHNYRTVDATYDVCYCDGNCLNPQNWFKVGEIKVKAVTILGPSVVKVQSNIQLQGTEGSWTTQGDADLREMKVLMDTHATVGSNECFEQFQSTELVGGHFVHHVQTALCPHLGIMARHMQMSASKHQAG